LKLAGYRTWPVVENLEIGYAIETYGQTFQWFSQEGFGRLYPAVPVCFELSQGFG
jgi:hypothetical protein